MSPPAFEHQVELWLLCKHEPSCPPAADQVGAECKDVFPLSAQPQLFFILTEPEFCCSSSSLLPIFIQIKGSTDSFFFKLPYTPLNTDKLTCGSDASDAQWSFKALNCFTWCHCPPKCHRRHSIRTDSYSFSWRYRYQLQGREARKRVSGNNLIKTQLSDKKKHCQQRNTNIQGFRKASIQVQTPDLIWSCRGSLSRLQTREAH